MFDRMGTLSYICGTTNANGRRKRVEALLRHWFEDRLIVERRKWPKAKYSKFWAPDDTVNFMLTFGDNPSELVVGAHYDAVPNAPGANDNGAAVVQLMEVAYLLDQLRLMGQQEPNVTICFWDHEEIFGSKYMGSKLFLKTRSPKQAIVVDVSGIGEAYVSDSDEVGLFPDLPVRKTPPSDNMNFQISGVPVTLICALPPDQLRDKKPAAWDTMHTKKDAIDIIDPDTMAQMPWVILDAIALNEQLNAREPEIDEDEEAFFSGLSFEAGSETHSCPCGGTLSTVIYGSVFCSECGRILKEGSGAVEPNWNAEEI